MENMIEVIRKDLRASANEKDRLSSERFFREEIKLYGMKSKEITRISREYSEKVKNCQKKRSSPLRGIMAKRLL